MSSNFAVTLRKWWHFTKTGVSVTLKAQNESLIIAVIRTNIVWCVIRQNCYLLLPLAFGTFCVEKVKGVFCILPSRDLFLMDVHEKPLMEDGWEASDARTTSSDSFSSLGSTQMTELLICHLRVDPPPAGRVIKVCRRVSWVAARPRAWTLWLLYIHTIVFLPTVCFIYNKLQFKYSYVKMFSLIENRFDFWYFYILWNVCLQKVSYRNKMRFNHFLQKHCFLKSTSETLFFVFFHKFQHLAII